jgi:D-glycero-alpha-D-manno-heptose-7-phosphate kinase
MVQNSKASSLPDYTLRERATIITQSPMRITLAGGGTDVLWYSKLKGGAWISGAINKYVFVFLNKTEDPKLIKAAHGTEAIMTYNYRKIPNPLIREALRIAGITSGIEVSTAADASARSGLGGSGAFEVSLLNALHTYKREHASPLVLAEEACKIEIEKLKRPVGPNDQYIAALGGVNYFEINKKGEVLVEPLNLSLHTVAKLESNLLYFRTGMQRDASSVLQDEKKKVEKKKTDKSKNVIKALDEIKELGQHAKKLLLKQHIDDFGKTFHEHWLIKKRLSEKVSNSKIDKWYDEAIKAGALGGKIIGAGGGGWLVFYVPENKAYFRERMEKLGLEERRVRFDWEGAKVLINLS